MGPALSFSGLGTDQQTPEWGLILAEGIGYAERTPWLVLAPAGALVVASVLPVSLARLSWSLDARQTPAKAAPDPRRGGRAGPGCLPDRGKRRVIP